MTDARRLDAARLSASSLTAAVALLALTAIPAFAANPASDTWGQAVKTIAIMPGTSISVWKDINRSLVTGGAVAMTPLGNGLFEYIVGLTAGQTYNYIFFAMDTTLPVAGGLQLWNEYYDIMPSSGQIRASRDNFNWNDTTSAYYASVAYDARRVLSIPSTMNPGETLYVYNNFGETPGIVAGFNAAAEGDTQIRLTWTGVYGSWGENGEAFKAADVLAGGKYEIYQSNTNESGPWTILASLDGSQTSYLVSGLGLGGTYYYCMRAKDAYQSADTFFPQLRGETTTVDSATAANAIRSFFIVQGGDWNVIKANDGLAYFSRPDAPPWGEKFPVRMVRVTLPPPRDIDPAPVDPALTISMPYTRRAQAPRATIYDVANEAGVSIATVSRVLKNFPSIAPATRKRVEASIRKLSYRPSVMARSLATSIRRSLGVIIPGGPRAYASLFLADVLAGIADEARAAGWSLHLTSVGDCAQNDGLQRHADVVDGSLVLDEAGLDPRVRDLVAAGHRIVALNRAFSGVPSIVVDNLHGGRQAISHLVRLGHRNIALLGGLDHVGPDRAKGWILELRQQGLKPAAHVDCRFDRAAATRAALTILKSRRPPTAIVTASDWMATGVIDAAAEMGLRIPDDLSLVGFDDALIAETSMPPLTTIRQPLKKMGADAFSLFRANLARPQPRAADEPVVLPTELVVRASTAPPR